MNGSDSAMPAASVSFFPKPNRDYLYHRMEYSDYKYIYCATLLRHRPAAVASPDPNTVYRVTVRKVCGESTYPKVDTLTPISETYHVLHRFSDGVVHRFDTTTGSTTEPAGWPFVQNDLPRAQTRRVSFGADSLGLLWARPDPRYDPTAWEELYLEGIGPIYASRSGRSSPHAPPAGFVEQLKRIDDFVISDSLIQSYRTP